MRQKNIDILLFLTKKYIGKLEMFILVATWFFFGFTLISNSLL